MNLKREFPAALYFHPEWIHKLPTRISQSHCYGDDYLSFVECEYNNYYAYVWRFQHLHCIIASCGFRVCGFLVKCRVAVTVAMTVTSHDLYTCFHFIFLNCRRRFFSATVNLNWKLKRMKEKNCKLCAVECETLGGSETVVSGMTVERYLGDRKGELIQFAHTLYWLNMHVCAHIFFIVSDTRTGDMENWMRSRCCIVLCCVAAAHKLHELHMMSFNGKVGLICFPNEILS